MKGKLRDIDDIIGYITAIKELKFGDLNFSSNDGRNWVLKFMNKSTHMKTRDLVIMIRLWVVRDGGDTVIVTDYDNNTFAVAC